MLKRLRIALAVASILAITLLLLDFTGVTHRILGWMARIQLVPAILAVNVAVLAGLALLTLLLGRVYCSVVCPLGIVQDAVSNISGRRKGRKNRFHYRRAKNWLRYSLLVLCAAAMVAGVSAAVSLLDPYAAYGRVASELLSPLYRWGNNLLALAAERVDSYAFYSSDVWVKGGITLAVAVVTLLVVGVMSWRGGRNYCNQICPVGTLLGLVSRFSIVRIRVDENKCNHCKLCERRCKSSCIDSENMSVDASRCVGCFDCVEVCKTGAIKYSACKPRAKKPTEAELPAPEGKEGMSRRAALSVMALAIGGGALKAQQLKVDGGLADIADKKAPDRKTPIVPPGAEGAAHMKQHCTACQLCVAACPTGVLRPSNRLSTLMQPEMSFERGHCRPECVECSAVCPSGAIKPLDAAEKSAISIGWAVWIEGNCVVNADQLPCDACQRHCPTGAITLVERRSSPDDKLKVPAVNKELCIGCGACEHFCPARPLSAIYVEGNQIHHEV